MNKQLYKKKGKRYIPIGYSDGFNGFPSEGFWLITEGDGVKSSECIIKIDELEALKPAVNLIYGYQDKIVQYMTLHPQKYVSLNEYVLTMLKEISK